ncbi:MAG: DUF393 domain-containing protein [Actinobacteria bacterium]|nr:DUF393 domain-containing protein [Actinomycetota bacterium]
MATVVYDGYCNLCNGTVGFLYRNARPETLDFVSNPEPDQTTVVVIDGGREYTKSDAVLQAAHYLRRPWPALRVLRIVPRSLRDRVYDVVAANRYRWFGRRDTCAIAPASSASAAAGSANARSRPTSSINE